MKYDGTGMSTPKKVSGNTGNAKKRPAMSDVPTGQGGPKVFASRKSPLRGK